jgi:FkbM family methyltransferase
MCAAEPRGTRRRVAALGSVALLALLATPLLLAPPGYLTGPRRHRVRTAPVTAAELEARLGPARYSQGYEELIVRDFFADAWRGRFVDVGAGHYRDHSTTYFLERHRSWRGVAVDANADWAADYARFRPRTTFVTAFVGDREGGEAEFAVARNPLFSSGVLPLPADAVVRRVRVPRRTLDAILQERGLGRVDFLSIDVEGAEAAVLAGFDLRRYRPALVCIEVDKPGRERLFDWFRAAGYRELDAYRGVNEWNAYFTPIAPAPVPPGAKTVDTK